MANSICLAEYLFSRLKQLGVDSIHGVPGDFNLRALDYVAPAGLDWVGSCNELNAGYAADGYARVKGIGALVVTFGVGELSAINAIAGSFAEQVPVVLVVGSPPRSFHETKRYVHHTLGNGDYEVFARVVKEFTAAQAILMNPERAPHMIDDTLIECLKQSRPVYIQLPDDMAEQQVSKSLLSKPIDLSFRANDKSREDAVASKLLERIYSARQPFILVDGGTSRYGFAEEVDRLVRTTGFPTATTPFGKGIQDETVPNFHGVYQGVMGKLNYASWAKKCDLVMRFGPDECSLNTVGFSTIPAKEVRIDFYHHSIEMNGLEAHETDNLYVKNVLKCLLVKLEGTRIHKYDPYPDLGTPRKLLEALSPVEDKQAPIDQKTFFQRISSFFRPGDVILTETGTMSVGGREFVLPPNTMMVNSTTWLSIGFMLPASQGVSIAQQDMAKTNKDGPVRRTVLFQGDGSFQMTAQELSTVIKKQLNLTFFLINNDGYTIERMIHGMKASYNDIAPWNYRDAPAFFGAATHSSYPVHTQKATNWGELEAALKDVSDRERGLNLIEVIMDREDCPDSLRIYTKMVEDEHKAEQAG
ncbi:MAG: hypothetical protein LQ340_001740 [Diploschistes diacapsis]|nr:MAG: hypothetical protein LQ340_001740 [Diploschistes diacapsis]